MESLSQEILDLIVLHLFEVPPTKDPIPRDLVPVRDVAQYATISRRWQVAVERYTMADIKKYNSELDMFRQVFSFPRRRKYLRRLRYEIDLPTYSNNRIFCLERPRESRANNEAFTQGVLDLFDFMNSWETSGIELTITASSPMDPGRRPSELGPGLADERWAFEDKYLTLQDDLPELRSIKSLKIPNEARSLHPSAIGRIIASLLGLEQLTMELKVPKTKRVDMQEEHRLCLAKALESPTLKKLRMLSIDIAQDIPRNHNFKNRPNDPNYPDGDALNVAIRKLAESHLTSLSLTGDWLVSPALFDGQKKFPYLERVQIEGALITYDARWHFTGNPDAVNASFEDTRNDEDDMSDSDTNSSLNSEYADSLPEGREALLNGDNPHHLWRTNPDPQMCDPLMKAMATAVLRMPSLQNLRFSVAANSLSHFGIIVEILQPSEQPEWLEYSRTADELDKTLCCVTLMPLTSWVIPTDIESLFKEVVGEKGIVAVETF